VPGSKAVSRGRRRQRRLQAERETKHIKDEAETTHIEDREAMRSAGR